MKPKIIQSEIRYFDDEKMITGQIDCVAFMHDRVNLPTLIDFKTSSAEAKESWPLQAHLYAYLLARNNMLLHPCYLFIQLNKEGDLPKVFKYLCHSNIHAKCMNAIDNFWNKQKVLTKDGK